MRGASATRPWWRLGRAATVLVVSAAAGYVGVLSGATDSRAASRGPTTPVHASTSRPASKRSIRTRGPAPPSKTPANSTPGVVQVLHAPVPGMPGTTRDVYVYRPPVPDSKLLPVLYFLHAVPGGPGDVFQQGGLGRLLDRYFARGNAPFVLAAPDGNGAHHADTEWANAVAGNDQIETFVTDNVIDTVEGTNRRDKEHRAIAGFSMGGYGAINLGLRHPDLYGMIVSMAGYFHVDDPSGMFANDLAALHANTPELHVAKARAHRVFIVDGNHDDERVVKGQSQQFAAKLIAADALSWFEDTQGTHNWAFVNSAFPDVERFLDARWASLRPKGPRMPPQAIATVSGHWSGMVASANVDVVVPAPASDAVASSIEQLRDAVSEPELSYVAVTIANPRSATGPVSIAKVSFLTRRGVTITANEPIALVNELQEAATTPAQVAAAQRILDQLAPAAVAPGRTETFTYVTTGPLPSVKAVFAGTSFGSNPLAPLPGTPHALRPK